MVSKMCWQEEGGVKNAEFPGASVMDEPKVLFSLHSIHLEEYIRDYDIT